ncbi:hypothetical protein PYW08_007988 [Mythimna loreyi]|uniref:Uncharacterized protein n=1 Tax=Mythimna loreyi TaxID=667449 RepID=A0ACC2QA13_9NEOP|nr:hypothetical protein PYW08_007988 [Mythimna loreyi]
MGSNESKLRESQSQNQVSATQKAHTSGRTNQNEDAVSAVCRKLQEESAYLSEQRKKDEEARLAAHIKLQEEIANLAAQRKLQEQIFKNELGKLQDEVAKVAMQRKLQEEAHITAQRKLHEEAAKRTIKEYVAKKKLLEEAAQKKILEEAAKKTLEKERAKNKLEEGIAAKKKLQEESESEKMRQEIVAEKIRQEIAAEIKRQEEAAEKRRQEEAAEKKRQEEAAEKKRQEEAAEKRRQEETAEKKRREEAAKKKFDKEAAKNAYEPATMSWQNLPRKAPVLRYCHTCYKQSTQDLYKCSEGHGSCRDCKDNEMFCGYCTEEITNRKSYNNKKDVPPHTRLPCPRKEFGCLLKIMIANMETHLKECPFQDHDCPIGSVFGNCKWQGEPSGLWYHFKCVHQNCIIEMGSEFQIGNIHQNRRYVRLIESGYNFVFHMKISEEDEKIYMTVQLMGTKHSAKKCLYEIHVYNKRYPSRNYVYKDNCCSTIDKIDDIFLNEDCAVLPIEYASTFVDNTSISLKCFIKRIDKKRRDRRERRYSEVGHILL